MSRSRSHKAILPLKLERMIGEMEKTPYIDHAAHRMAFHFKDYPKTEDTLFKNKCYSNYAALVKVLIQMEAVDENSKVWANSVSNSFINMLTDITQYLSFLTKEPFVKDTHHSNAGSENKRKELSRCLDQIAFIRHQGFDMIKGHPTNSEQDHQIIQNEGIIKELGKSIEHKSDLIVSLEIELQKCKADLIRLQDVNAESKNNVLSYKKTDNELREQNHRLFARLKQLKGDSTSDESIYDEEKIASFEEHPMNVSVKETEYVRHLIVDEIELQKDPKTIVASKIEMIKETLLFGDSDEEVKKVPIVDGPPCKKNLECGKKEVTEKMYKSDNNLSLDCNIVPDDKIILLTNKSIESINEDEITVQNVSTQINDGKSKKRRTIRRAFSNLSQFFHLK
uniref:DUF4485 domain-containing protein n=1 Tax=Rhabditophanes sp. KR3021 TaxID=114890 RepID=A0AC35TK09_9BILA